MKMYYKLYCSVLVLKKSSLTDTDSTSSGEHDRERHAPDENNHRKPRKRDVSVFVHVCWLFVVQLYA